jgi:Leucine-rich repeat (LRR) protein
VGALGQCALAHLNLRSNGITDLGAESLGGVHEQFVETCASTERMPVTGASLSRKQLPSLTNLYLHRTQIRDEGVVSLARAIGGMHFVGPFTS